MKSTTRPFSPLPRAPRFFHQRAGARQDCSADGVAGVDTFDALGQIGGPCPTGHGLNTRRKCCVHAPQHAVLFMDHPRDTQNPSRRERGDRRVTAKAHNDRGAAGDHLAHGREYPACDLERRDELGQRPTSGKCGGANLFNFDRVGKSARKARATVIRGQRNLPPLAHHRFGQRLRREHMPARAASSDDHARGLGIGHTRPRRKTSVMTPWGRLRVKAKSMPSVMPPAISDDPP